MSGHPAAVPPSSEFPPPHSITSSARGRRPGHTGAFSWAQTAFALRQLGAHPACSLPRCRTSAPRPRFTLPLPRWASSSSKPDVSRAAGRPCAPASCEPRHGTRPTCDGRAVGSKEKGGRTWNQSSCRKLWLRQLLGRTVMTNLTISELLMLTCCGAFIASVTYAVKLSIEAF